MCENFRDVGEWLTVIAGLHIIPEKCLLRGGKLDFVTTAAEIGNPKTIINLRYQADAKEKGFGATQLHFPIANKIEKYNTKLPEVQKWLNDIFWNVQSTNYSFPIFIHCASGKDRTGIVIAILLKILQIPEEWIVEEYLFSNGDISRDLIQGSLEGIGNIHNYLNKVNLVQVRQKFDIPGT